LSLSGLSGTIAIDFIAPLSTCHRWSLRSLWTVKKLRNSCPVWRGKPTNVPIAMVTASSDTYDVVAGLEAGADDYVVKPVVAKELAARVRALLRRANPVDQEDATVRLGDVVLYSGKGVVRKGGENVELTKTEFRILCELAERPGWVVSRAQLLERVWGYDFFGDMRLVEYHISRMRAKLEKDPSKPKLIVTVRGLGYKLSEDL